MKNMKPVVLVSGNCYQTTRRTGLLTKS